MKKSKKSNKKIKATNKIVRKYGWIKDKEDIRDKKYSAICPVKVSLPPKIDLRPACPPVYNQGSLGSCSANAIGAAFQYEQIIQNDKNNFIPSRLFIYYNERVMENSVNSDDGAMIRDGLKSVANQGVCPETEWPYVISKFAKQPPKQCYTDALDNQVESYHSLDCDINQMKQCLADGYPFVFGATIIENFENDEVTKTGIIPMPSGNQVGGHALMCVGYSDEDGVFIVRNSWGSSWGMSGYCTFPYDYLTNPDLCSDFWTIRMVEIPTIPAPTPAPIKLSWWQRFLAWLRS